MDSPYLKRKLRIVGDIPEGYAGPIYYRIIENQSGPYFTDKFEVDAESAERRALLHDPRNKDRNILTSGLVLDPEGKVLPEWQAPLKYNILQDKPLSFEFMPGGLTSERVHDVIEALDPGKHVFIPIDARWPDGRIERLYSMKWGADFFNADVSTPVLNPKLSHLELGTYTNGVKYYKHPDWIMGREVALNPFHFGFLNQNLIGNLNLFAAEILNNAAVLSEPLMTELRKFGNVFHGADWYVRMGIA